jgi:hypothetical protein
VGCEIGDCAAIEEDWMASCCCCCICCWRLALACVVGDVCALAASAASNASSSCTGKG